MKKLILILAMTLTAFGLLADEGHDHGKSCEMMNGGKSVELTGKVTCKGSDDCTFQTADAKSTWKVCEMSKVDVSKLSASDAAVKVKGRITKCEHAKGEEVLVIEQLAQ
jgi:hypothetical protein